MFGRPLSPEELEFIRTQIEALDAIGAVKAPRISLRSKRLPVCHSATRVGDSVRAAPCRVSDRTRNPTFIACGAELTWQRVTVGRL
jgi:hypothetical protein